MDSITINTIIRVPLPEVWKFWTDPAHIVNWNHASDEWHTPRAENDLTAGGKFSYRMEAKDGSFGFDFSGSYDSVETHESIQFKLDDGRKVSVSFEATGETTTVTEVFEPEKMNPIDMQRDGWQAILNNFGRYAENVHSNQ